MIRLSLAASLLLYVADAASAATLLRDDFFDPASGWPNMAATRDSDLGFAVYTDGGQYQLTPVKDNVFGFIAGESMAGTSVVFDNLVLAGDAPQ